MSITLWLSVHLRFPGERDCSPANSPILHNDVLNVQMGIEPPSWSATRAISTELNHVHVQAKQ